MRQNPFRNLTLLVFLCCALLYVTRFAAQYDFFRPSASSPQIGISHDFPYTRLDGSTGFLRDHDGRKTVIHFWATWCPPCITELPELIDKAATRPDVDFLLISVDKDQARLRHFLQPYQQKLKTANITMIHDLSANIATDHMKVSGFPESFFLDSGRYQTRHIKGPVKWVSFDDF